MKGSWHGGLDQRELTMPQMGKKGQREPGGLVQNERSRGSMSYQEADCTGHVPD